MLYTGELNLRIGFGILIALTVAAFSASDATAQTADKDYFIKLGYSNCDHMTAAPVGKDAGIFEELGLKVEVVGNTKVPEAMAGSQTYAGYIGFERTVRGPTGPVCDSRLLVSGVSVQVSVLARVCRNSHPA
jgi:NitT/TauT family transport system substrate-binding protein